MHVLLSTFSCVPGEGSEPGAGWGFLWAAAQNHDVTAIVEASQLPDISDGLREEGLDSVRLIGLEIPPVPQESRYKRGIGHLAYLVWQLRAARLGRRFVSEIDVAHHVTYGVDWMPTGMWALSKTPVVWGPVGGTAAFHPGYVRYLSPTGALQEIAREVVSRTMRAGFVAPIARRRCDVVVACNPEVAERFDTDNTVVESQVALEPLFAGTNRRPVSPRFEQSRTAIFVGRLEAWKGPYLALETLARLGESWRLEIYGEGKEGKGLRRRAERLGLLGKVDFRGARPRSEVKGAMSRTDVLLFPSFHDASGFVVAEAIQVGCPVVCLDTGGPGMLVRDGGGIAVPIGRQLSERLACAVTEVEPQTPSKRWDMTRLPDQVTHWYELARQRRSERQRAR